MRRKSGRSNRRTKSDNFIDKEVEKSRRLEEGIEKGSLVADFRLCSLSSVVQSFLGSLMLLYTSLR